MAMADVQVSVGLGRKARLHDNIAELLRAQVFNDDVADEVRRAGLRRRRSVQISVDLWLRAHVISF
jgi:hypothetical protein